VPTLNKLWTCINHLELEPFRINLNVHLGLRELAQLEIRLKKQQLDMLF
jgi:hypothetical protein